MLDPTIHESRRRTLARLVPDPVLLMGNGHRARNLPADPLPFRQDSTFLYYTGCALPYAAALLVDGRCTLFLPAPDPDDALWMGPSPSLSDLRVRYGVDEVRPVEDLDAAVDGLALQTLAVPDEDRNRLASRLAKTELRFGKNHGHRPLVDAVIAMRRAKGPEELAEMRLAAERTHAAYLAVMRSTRPGSNERALHALFEAVLACRDCKPAFPTILSQSGEILHNERHDQELAEGRLLLLDAGGEMPSGYGVDVTRTWPVSGRFDSRQKAVYEVVLEAQRAAIETCRLGTRYREVHDAASRVFARWLRDEKLIHVSEDESVEIGAHAVFFPHGIGHLLGLDVHDLENFGDIPAYPPGQGRSSLFGTGYLRLDLPLEENWVVTIEPGFYVVPAILADRRLRERLAGKVDFERGEAWIGFGGIRIEDDVRITPMGPEVLTSVPKAVADVEAIVGSGPPAEELVCCSS